MEVKELVIDCQERFKFRLVSGIYIDLLDIKRGALSQSRKSQDNKPEHAGSASLQERELGLKVLFVKYLYWILSV